LQSLGISFDCHFSTSVGTIVHRSSGLHSRLRNSLIVLKCFIVMHFVRVSLIVFLALQDRQKTLVNANVLLLSLHHPNSFFSHLVHNTKYVHHVVFSNSLKNSIKGYEGTRSSNSRTAVSNYRALFWANSLTECSDKPSD